MNKNASKHCAPSRWERLATEEALAGGIDPVRLLSGARTRPYVLARWRVWQRLKALGYSYKSIGHASGFDHTTVMHGVKAGFRSRKLADLEKRRAAKTESSVSGYSSCLASGEISVIGNRPSHEEAA